jgi:hypothetical protein
MAHQRTPNIVILGGVVGIGLVALKVISNLHLAYNALVSKVLPCNQMYCILQFVTGSECDPLPPIRHPANCWTRPSERRPAFTACTFTLRILTF